jgi:hypothetical protein
VILRLLPQESKKHQRWHTDGRDLWRRWDGLRCHDIHTKFYEERHKITKIVSWDTYTARWPHKPTHFFFQNDESRLKSWDQDKKLRPRLKPPNYSQIPNWQSKLSYLFCRWRNREVHVDVCVHNVNVSQKLLGLLLVLLLQRATHISGDTSECTYICTCYVSTYLFVYLYISLYTFISVYTFSETVLQDICICVYVMWVCIYLYTFKYIRLFFKYIYAYLFIFMYLYLRRCFLFGEMPSWKILILSHTCSLLCHVTGKQVRRTEVWGPSHAYCEVFFVWSMVKLHKFHMNH